MSPRNRPCVLKIALSLGILTSLLLFCAYAFAAEGPSPARRIWDNIMLWVNFGILAFFFLKYAKKPLLEYLHGVRHKVGEDLGVVESQMNGVKVSRDEQAEKLKGIKDRLREIQEGILEMGRREKERLIEQAKISAEKMIENARTYSEYRIAMAKKALADEMVDTAVGMVEERLARILSVEDNEKLINQFVTDLITSKERFNQDSK